MPLGASSLHHITGCPLLKIDAYTIMRTPFFVLLLMLVWVLPVTAQTSYKDLTFPELPDFEIPQAEKVVLPNGMTVFLIEDHGLPLINMSARFGVGALYEAGDKAGLASVMGTVMRTGGTTTMTGDEINAKLESIGASVETFVGQTSGSAQMSTLTEHLDEVLAIYADVIRNPAFPEEQITLAKTQSRSGISRRNDNPQQIASRELSQLIYGEDSPYARSTEYYTISAIERADLVAFHQAFYHPNNTILGVWGDFDTDAMVEKLTAVFGDWPRAEGFRTPDLPPMATTDDYSVNYAEKTDINQSTVFMGHLGEVQLNHPDFPAITVMNQVLSGGFTSRLFDNVRTKQGLAYAVFGNYGANYNRPGQFFAGVMTKSESTVEAAQSVLREIENMQAAPPTAEEVELAKDSYLNSFVFQFDTRSEVVGRMMTYEYYGYPTSFLQTFKEGVEAVGPADVHRVSKQYLKPDEVAVVVVGNDADFGEPLSALGEVNEIDISIPTTAPGAEEEVSEDALRQGRTVLEEVIHALGGAEAFAALETIQMKSTQKASTPMGEMEIESEMAAVLPEAAAELETAMGAPDQLMQKQKTPMGDVTVVVNGDEAVLKTPQGNQALPASARSQIEAQMWQTTMYLLRNANHPKLTVQYIGTEEIDGETLEVLRITPPVGGPMTMLIDGDKRPVRMRYQAPNRMTGAPSSVEDVYTDYRAVNGVLFAHQTISYVDGDKGGETTVLEIIINGELDPSLFDTN